MIQKCANPECDAEFRYVSRGRLSSFELRHPIAPCRDIPPAICERKPSHAAIHFWLCENCSSTLSLHFTMKIGLSVVAVSETAGSRGTSESLKPSLPPEADLGRIWLMPVFFTSTGDRSKALVWNKKDMDRTKNQTVGQIMSFESTARQTGRFL